MFKKISLKCWKPIAIKKFPKYTKYHKNEQGDLLTQIALLNDENEKSAVL